MDQPTQELHIGIRCGSPLASRERNAREAAVRFGVVAHERLVANAIARGEAAGG